VLIHCTAGKDRTGFTAAILLAVLGVPDEAIYADYSLSNRAYPVFYEGTARSVQPLARIGLYPDDLHVLLLADPAVMQALFGRLREQYGSLERYLAACAGVDARTLEQLRARLLESAADAD
jgi:protein-tyrosine phosphatase